MAVRILILGAMLLPIFPSLGFAQTGRAPSYSVEEQKDNNTGCTLAELDGATRISRTGGHHFGGDYDDIARIILERLNAVGEK